jgi:hypothetical protein
MDDQTVVASGWPEARLVVRQGAQVGKTFSLGRQAVVLGREESAEVSLQDPEMSRRHAGISWRDGAYVLEDLRSTNGTYLNGTLIRAPQQLNNGDTIGVGHTVVEFEWPAGAQPRQPVYEEPRYSAQPQQPAYQEPRYSAPTPPPPMPLPPSPPPPMAAPPPPAVREQAREGPSRCLLIGCGCLVLLVLLAVGALAVVMFAMPEQLKDIQKLLDEYGVPIQLTMAYLSNLVG